MSHAAASPSCSRSALGAAFPQAALPVLRNAQLRKNVAHATDVIQAKRARLVAEKTDWQELRSAASAIRAHALENLGAYLEQFEARCTAAGGTSTGPRTPPKRARSSSTFCARRTPPKSSRSRP